MVMGVVGVGLVGVGLVGVGMVIVVGVMVVSSRRVAGEVFEIESLWILFWVEDFRVLIGKDGGAGRVRVEVPRDIVDNKVS